MQHLMAASMQIDRCQLNGDVARATFAVPSPALQALVAHDDLSTALLVTTLDPRNPPTSAESRPDNTDDCHATAQQIDRVRVQPPERPQPALQRILGAASPRAAEILGLMPVGCKQAINARGDVLAAALLQLTALRDPQELGRGFRYGAKQFKETLVSIAGDVCSDVDHLDSDDQDDVAGVAAMDALFAFALTLRSGPTPTSGDRGADADDDALAKRRAAIDHVIASVIHSHFTRQRCVATRRAGCGDALALLGTMGTPDTNSADYEELLRRLRRSATPTALVQQFLKCREGVDVAVAAVRRRAILRGRPRTPLGPVHHEDRASDFPGQPFQQACEVGLGRRAAAP